MRPRTIASIPETNITTMRKISRYIDGSSLRQTDIRGSGGHPKRCIAAGGTPVTRLLRAGEDFAGMVAAMEGAATGCYRDGLSACAPQTVFHKWNKSDIWGGASSTPTSSGCGTKS